MGNQVCYLHEGQIVEPWTDVVVVLCSRSSRLYLARCWLGG